MEYNKNSITYIFALNTIKKHLESVTLSTQTAP